MKKAVIVIDMPEDCEDCSQEYDGRCYHEHPCGREIKEGCKKPDWCPLRPLPERFYGDYGRYPQPDGIPPSYKVGWNACLDAITGEQDEKKNTSADRRRKAHETGQQGKRVPHKQEGLQRR